MYVKVSPIGITYYLEAVTTKYGNEPLLVNKQMIKTGIDDLPNLYGLKAAINKKQSDAEFLADLKKVHKAYAQSVYQNHSKHSISQSSENVKKKSSHSVESSSEASKQQLQYLIEFQEKKTPGQSNTATKDLLRSDQASYGNSIAQNQKKSTGKSKHYNVFQIKRERKQVTTCTAFRGW